MVTLYIYKNDGECSIVSYEVQEGTVILYNAEQIKGFGFVQDNSGPSILIIVLAFAGGALLLLLFLIPILAKRR